MRGPSSFLKKDDTAFVLCLVAVSLAAALFCMVWVLPRLGGVL